MRHVEERNLFAALAVLLIAYALVALLALGARGEPATVRIKRLWRRLMSRRRNS
jgi:hypothetical protein